MYTPQNADSLISDGKRAYYAGDFRSAASLLGQALHIESNHLEGLLLYASAMNRLGAPEQAIAALSRGIGIDDSLAHFHVEMGNAYLQLGDLNAAHAAINQAIALNPGDEPAVAAKADIFRMEGDYDAAYALLRPMVEGGSMRLAISFGQVCRQLGRFGEGIDCLQPHVDRPDLAAGAGVQALYALGDLYDANAEYERAFECFRRANTARPSHFDIEAHEASVDRMIGRWTPVAFAAVPESCVESDLPVFVLGMPRSGTSLTEQILSCHPQVHGIGEFIGVSQFAAHVQGVQPPALPLIEDPTSISEHEIKRFAGAYVEHVQKQGDGAARVTDKYPSNVFHIGSIVRAFPHGRVVHCTRDPLDTCLSCFANNFAGAAMDFKQDLGVLGRYYRSYDRLMRHWASIVGDGVFASSYESLVGDQEAHTRDLIAYLGLEWDDACLRFHESARVTLTRSNAQVRRPMYTKSVGRWRNYEAHLGPLVEALGDLV